MTSSGIALSLGGYRQELFPFVGGYNLVGTWPANGGLNAGSLFNAVFQNTSNAQHDAISFDLFLPAGTFSLDTCYRRVSAGAIAHVALDGTGVADVDTYGAATAEGQVQTSAGIVIGASGLHTMRVSADARNGAATGWTLQFEYFVWRRTA